MNLPHIRPVAVARLGYDSKTGNQYPIPGTRAWMTERDCPEWNNGYWPQVIAFDIDGKNVRDSIYIYESKIKPVLAKLSDRKIIVRWHVAITRRGCYSIFPFVKNLNGTQREAWVNQYFPQLPDEVDRGVFAHERHMWPKGVMDGETPHHKTGRPPEILEQYGKGLNPVPKWLEKIKTGPKNKRNYTGWISQKKFAEAKLARIGWKL